MPSDIKNNYTSNAVSLCNGIHIATAWVCKLISNNSIY